MTLDNKLSRNKICSS